MFLLPFIMEHTMPPNAKYVQDEEESTRKLNFYDYIYLMNENELLKFKIELDHMDVVNVLEKYIDSQSTFDKVILSEKDLEGTKIPLKFLYPLGNYRLENNLFKTKNYLVPKRTEFLDIITEKYWDGMVDSTDLYNLNSILPDAVCDEDDVTKKLISDLFNSANVELVESFEMNIDEVENTINNIRTLLNNSTECQNVLKKLDWILKKSKFNMEYITKLGLKDKFNNAITQERERQKVK